MSQPRLHAVPLTLPEANELVRKWHRHHLPATGHRWSVGVADEAGDIRGCAITSRPVARMTDQYRKLEIVRVATDGCPNACSFLYGRVRRLGELFGYDEVFTFILASEPGTSLRAAGYVEVATSAGGSWNRPSRKRENDHPLEPKRKFVARMNGGEHAD